MNLSQILNPPGASVAPLSESTHVGRGQGRTSSPLPPTALVSTTTVLRFDTPLNGSPGGTSARKHANSVSVAQLEEQSAHHPNTGKHNSSSTSNSPHPKIKPNEISNGYSTHTFRANAPVQSVAVTKEKAPATFTTDNSAASNGPSGTRTGTGIGAQAAAAGITDTFSQGQKNHNVPQGLSSSTSTAKKRPRSQASRSGKTSFLFISPTPSAQQESKNGSLRKVGRPTLMVMDDDAQPHGRPSPRLSEDDAQPLEIRFVMTDKDGQDKQRTMKPTTPSTPKSDSPARDSQGEDSTDQELSSTPDFERNADGKFRCSWPRCGKEFTVASRLTTHYRIHSGKPPYLCGYKDCQKAFHTSSSLSHHRVVHTDQNLRPYVCRHNRCGATYTQLARLITHQRTTHSGTILFIPQEASSPQSQSQAQSLPQSASTTPLGTPRDEPFSAPLSQPTTPSASTFPINGSAHAITGSSSPPTGSLTRRISEVAHQNTAGPLNEDHPQSSEVETNIVPSPTSLSGSSATPLRRARSSSHSPVAPSNSLPPNGVTPKNGPSNDYSSCPERSIENHDRHRERGSEIVEEDEDSDEMRLKKEAALTMTSFREMVMLQHQRSLQPAASRSPPGYQSSHQQPPPPQPNGPPYPSSDYRYSQSSYREYASDTYHQRPSHRPSSPTHYDGRTKSSTGQHFYKSYSEEYWKDGHNRGTPKPDTSGYTHPGPRRVSPHLQQIDPHSEPRSNDIRYSHYPRSPPHQEHNYRSTMGEPGYDRPN